MARAGIGRKPWLTAALGFVHSHPSPAEYVEVLQELQRLESRLQPFLQRYYEVLGAAATTDYNNNVSPPTPSPPAPPDGAGRSIDHFPCPAPQKMSSTELLLFRKEVIISSLIGKRDLFLLNIFMVFTLFTLSYPLNDLLRKFIK